MGQQRQLQLQQQQQQQQEMQRRMQEQTRLRQQQEALRRQEIAKKQEEIRLKREADIAQAETRRQESVHIMVIRKALQKLLMASDETIAECEKELEEVTKQEIG